VQLRELREQAVLSLSEVAQSLNVARATVSRWESGSRMPSMASIRELAKLYNQEPQFVLQVAKETYKPQSQE
jgi:transcriptional regulator with XRE-family HTH domain